MDNAQTYFETNKKAQTYLLPIKFLSKKSQAKKKIDIINKKFNHVQNITFSKHFNVKYNYQKHQKIK